MKKKNNLSSKEILKYLLVGGAITLSASNPYFILNVYKNISNFKKYKQKQFTNSFEYLKKRGLIEVRKNNYDIEIFLTKEGENLAGKYQINDLEIKIPEKWDKKWRVIIFDIPDYQKVQRNVFRGKIREFGFYAIQKSVWIYPYDCKKEIELLKNFLGLQNKDIQIIVAEKIENDEKIKKYFKLI